MEKKKSLLLLKNKENYLLSLTADEKIVMDILQTQEQVHIDELFIKSKLSSSAVAAALLMLEMQNVVSLFTRKNL